MDVLSVAVLAVDADTFQGFEGILDRVQLDLRRSGLTLAALLVVGVLMSMAVPKYLVFPAAFGSAWLTWHLFNKFTDGPDTVLFTNEPDMSQPWDFLWGAEAEFFATVLGIALAVLVFVLGKNNNQKEKTPMPIRILAAVGTWFGVVLVYQLFLR